MIIKLIFISFLIMNLLLACEKQDNKEVTSENNSGGSTDDSSDKASLQDSGVPFVSKKQRVERHYEITQKELDRHSKFLKLITDPIWLRSE